VGLEWLAAGRGYKQRRPQVPEGYAAIPFFDVRAAGRYVYPLFSADNAEILVSEARLVRLSGDAAFKPVHRRSYWHLSRLFEH
jgi:hypothetical protein